MVLGSGFMDWGRFVRTVSATHLEYLFLESISGAQQHNSVFATRPDNLS